MCIRDRQRPWDFFVAYDKIKTIFVRNEERRYINEKKDTIGKVDRAVH